MQIAVQNHGTDAIALAMIGALTARRRSSFADAVVSLVMLRSLHSALDRLESLGSARGVRFTGNQSRQANCSMGKLQRAVAVLGPIAYLTSESNSPLLTRWYRPPSQAYVYVRIGKVLWNGSL